MSANGVTGATSGRLKVAKYWAASCGGCEVAVLDINEKILGVLEVADVVFTRRALDFPHLLLIEV